MAHGRKNKARSTLRPWNGSFNKSAMDMPSANFRMSAARVKTTVTRTDCQNWLLRSRPVNRSW
jgi:hypothetical protein